MILHRVIFAIVFSVSDIALAQSLIRSFGNDRMITPHQVKAGIQLVNCLSPMHTSSTALRSFK